MRSVEMVAPKLVTSLKQLITHFKSVLLCFRSNPSAMWIVTLTLLYTYVCLWKHVPVHQQTSTCCPFSSNLISASITKWGMRRVILIPKKKKKAFPVNEWSHLLFENIRPFLLRIKYNIHSGHRKAFMHHVMESIKYLLPLGKGQRSMTFTIWEMRFERCIAAQAHFQWSLLHWP